MTLSKFLILDCSGAVSTVRVVSELENFVRSSPSNGGHSESIATLIDLQLAEAGLSITNLEGVAVVSGPGSFTGLRIAASHLSGISSALKVPMVSVPLHLSALALCYLADSGEDSRLSSSVVVSPAGRDSFFLSDFSDAFCLSLGSAEGRDLHSFMVTCPVVNQIGADDLVNVTNGRGVVFVSDSSSYCASLLMQLEYVVGLSSIIKVDDCSRGAELLLRLVEWPSFSVLSSSQIELCYVRPVNAKTIAERQMLSKLLS